MKSTLGGRTGLLLAVATLFLGLLPSAVAGAQTCFGEPPTLVGTADGELLKGTRGDDVIVARGGDDEVIGRRGDDLICGGEGTDILRGRAGDDMLNAGGGDFETVEGGFGQDFLDGGSGTHQDANYESAARGVNVNLLLGRARGQGHDELVRLDQIVGSPFDDRLVGTNEDNPGLYGFDGSDTLLGRGGNDYMIPGYGDDHLNGGGGSDYVDNFLDFYTDEQDAVVLDLVKGSLTGQGNDTLAGVESGGGTRGDDVMIGNDEANEFSSLLDGADEVHAGGGDDDIQPGEGADIVDGGPGTDEIWFFFDETGVRVDLIAGTATGQGADSLASIEDVLATDGDDVIKGTDESNLIVASGGDDVMRGRDGDDDLKGGRGTDEAFGGPGTDTCIVETAHDCE